MVFEEDIRLRIIAMLAEREEASLRELSRNLFVAHKSLAGHLDELMRKGIVEACSPETARRTYRITRQHGYLRELFRVHTSPRGVTTRSRPTRSGISYRSREIQAQSPQLWGRGRPHSTLNVTSARSA